jgi:hypothetical protein
MTKKHYFILKNINPTEIDAKYSFYIPEPPSLLETSCIGGDDGVMTTQSVSKISDLNRTKITDLAQKTKDPNTFSYLDESKKEHQCLFSMLNRMNENLPEKTDISCFWCRHPFNTTPIGCPIQFIPNRIVKSYHSEITKDNYSLRENITCHQLDENTSFYQENNINVSPRDIYITDGVFCSFNCCLAFIHAEQTHPLYTNSEYILKHMYTQLFGKNAQSISPAPSWRLLAPYGGTMTIDEFRKTFYKIQYTDIDNVVFPHIKSKSIGFLFDKIIRI